MIAVVHSSVAPKRMRLN